MEEYDRELIKVRTSGFRRRAGSMACRCRGTGISSSACRIRFPAPWASGHGGIIDLEREAELGGPIHTKAMLILKSYLVDQVRPQQAAWC